MDNLSTYLFITSRGKIFASSNICNDWHFLPCVRFNTGAS